MVNLKRVLAAKEVINKIKSPQNGRTYSLIHLIRGSYLKFIKYLQNSTPKKTNSTIKKWLKDLNRHFSKEDIRMANRHMKRCSMSLIIKEMKIRATIDTISHLSELLSSINQQTTSAGEDIERGQPCSTVGGNADWCSHYGKLYGDTGDTSKT